MRVWRTTVAVAPAAAFVVALIIGALGGIGMGRLATATESMLLLNGPARSCVTSPRTPPRGLTP